MKKIKKIIENYVPKRIRALTGVKTVNIDPDSITRGKKKLKETRKLLNGDKTSRQVYYKNELRIIRLSSKNKGQIRYKGRVLYGTKIGMEFFPDKKYLIS